MNSNPINGLSNGTSESGASSSRTRLDQKEFFKLMMAQLKSQDPFKPLDANQLFGQIAQFSTVAGIQDLQTSFAKLSGALQSNQALQAASLIGRSALVPSAIGLLENGAGLTGTVELPQETGELRLAIYDRNGQLVRHLPMGARSAGTTHFNWDGIRDDGAPAAPGLYAVRAEALVDGQTFALDTAVWAAVDSVTFGAPGQELSVNLVGLGSMGLSQVKQIR